MGTGIELKTGRKTMLVKRLFFLAWMASIALVAGSAASPGRSEEFALGSRGANLASSTPSAAPATEMKEDTEMATAAPIRRKLQVAETLAAALVLREISVIREIGFLPWLTIMFTNLFNGVFNLARWTILDIIPPIMLWVLNAIEFFFTGVGVLWTDNLQPALEGSS